MYSKILFVFLNMSIRQREYATQYGRRWFG